MLAGTRKRFSRGSKVMLAATRYVAGVQTVESAAALAVFVDRGTETGNVHGRRLGHGILTYILWYGQPLFG